MKPPPDSTKHSVSVRLNNHARTHWPALDRVEVRSRTHFVYIDGHHNDGTIIKLCRLRYTGSAHLWGFAIYRASHDDYQDSILPTGTPAGTAEQALDCACMLYLHDDPFTAPADTPTN